MLLYLSLLLADYISPFNVFRYLTLRSGAALVTSFALSVFLGGAFISYLRRVQKRGQPIREDGPQSHLITKRGTPTMGGLLMLGTATVSTLLWSDIFTPYVLPALLVMLGFGAIGFVDDYSKVTKHSVRGVSGRVRLAAAFVLAGVAAAWIYYCSPLAQTGAFYVPFHKHAFWHWGALFIPFAAFVQVGSANAVNLTDGLDGLATVPVAICAAALGLIAYLVGNFQFAEYLFLPHVPAAGELAVFCAALVGAAAGFLWFNAPPAEVFMGDTGALALGAGLGYVAVVTRHELVWALMGAVFVAETVSVMLQVASFRLTGRRIFKMAPLHHHFEQLGWKETKIVVRFWIVSFMVALLALSTLKLR